jgi:hypothetical protein
VAPDKAFRTQQVQYNSYRKREYEIAMYVTAGDDDDDDDLNFNLNFLFKVQ